MSHPTKKETMTLPITFVNAGVLKARLLETSAQVEMDSSITETIESLMEKVKTSAFRSLRELRDMKPESIRIFIALPTTDPLRQRQYGYMDRLRISNQESLQALVKAVVDRHEALQVEIWGKEDPASPSEFYKQFSLGRPVDSSRTSACKILQVEAIKVDEILYEKGGTIIMDKNAPIKTFSAPLLTSYCVRSFRKDLERRILEVNMADKKTYKVDVFFKRYHTVVVPGTRGVNESKDAFEGHVIRCIEKGIPLRIQYRMRGVKPSSVPQPAAATSSPSSSAKPVEVQEKRSVPASFGKTSAFGMQPAFTSPPTVTLPTSGKGFAPWLQSARVHSTNTGSATSFKTLHEGFYEAVKQASAARQAQPQLGGPSGIRSAPGLQNGSSFVEMKDGREAFTPTPGAQGQSSRPPLQSGLQQVELLLASFMVNLNQTLQDNFGANASTLSVFSGHSARDSVGSSRPPGCNRGPTVPCQSGRVACEGKLRHNATCNLCNQVIKGVRHKCATCPDWDCCETCRETAKLVHPGHCLIGIDSPHAITDPIRPADWVLHPGIRCDGCDGNIVGPRYKCVACEDFDYCANCEADPLIVHSEEEGHYFLKIDKPVRRSHVGHGIAQALEVVHSMHAPEHGNRQASSAVQSTVKAASLPEGEPSDVQELLAALTMEAQKLPGADRVPADVPLVAPLSADEEDDADESEKIEYDVQLVKDVTIPDGTIVLAGTQFHKSWVIQNTGKCAWPAATKLQVTSSSNTLNRDRSVMPLTKDVLPQETVEVSVKDLQAGEELGSQYVYFRLELPSVGKGAEGKRFGQQLWCQVQVVDSSGSASHSAESFLSASGDRVPADVSQWDEQGSSALGSSLFQAPKAPDSVAATSERCSTHGVQAEDAKSVSSVSSRGFGEEDDDDDDEYEIVDPTTEGEDTDSFSD